MTIQDLGSIGELVAAIATIATLAYLALQIRQNTDLGMGAAQRDLMSAFQLNLDRIARAPALWQRGLRDFESMSHQDQLEFQMVFNQFVNHLEQTLRMLDRGLESHDNVDIYGEICVSLILEPGGRKIWESTKPLFFPMSREYIERRLADESHLPPPISELLPWFAPDPENLRNSPRETSNV